MEKDKETNVTEENMLEITDSKDASRKPREIPQDLRDFFNRNYIVFVGGNGEPKEFSQMGDGFKGERSVTQEDLDSFSRETLIYLSEFKYPDFALKSFKSGCINFRQK